MSHETVIKHSFTVLQFFFHLSVYNNRLLSKVRASATEAYTRSPSNAFTKSNHISLILGSCNKYLRMYLQFQQVCTSVGIGVCQN